MGFAETSLNSIGEKRGEKATNSMGEAFQKERDQLSFVGRKDAPEAVVSDIGMTKQGEMLQVGQMRF